MSCCCSSNSMDDAVKASESAQEVAQWTQEQKQFMRHALEQVLSVHGHVQLQLCGKAKAARACAQGRLALQHREVPVGCVCCGSSCQAPALGTADWLVPAAA